MCLLPIRSDRMRASGDAEEGSFGSFELHRPHYLPRSSTQVNIDGVQGPVVSNVRRNIILGCPRLEAVVARLARFLALPLILASGTANAEVVLVEYGLTFACDSRSSFPATYTASGVAATGLSLVGLTGDDFNGFMAWDWGPTLSDTKYISFTIYPQASTPIPYSTISFSVLSSEYQPDYFGGPDSYLLRYRVGGTAWRDLLTIPNASDAITHVESADISSIGAQSQPVEFGLFGDGAMGSDAQVGGFASFGVGGSDITVTGAEVPEPATLLVWLGLGAAAITAARRRWKRAV